MAKRSASRDQARHPGFLAALPAALVIIVYWRLHAAELIHLDDPLYITYNPMVLAG